MIKLWDIVLPNDKFARCRVVTVQPKPRGEKGVIVQLSERGKDGLTAHHVDKLFGRITATPENVSRDYKLMFNPETNTGVAPPENGRVFRLLGVAPRI